MTKLSKLAFEIDQEILKCIKAGNENTTEWAHRIAENVALKYIEKAFQAGGGGFEYELDTAEKVQKVSFDEFIKENGLKNE